MTIRFAANLRLVDAHKQPITNIKTAEAAAFRYFDKLVESHPIDESKIKTWQDVLRAAPPFEILTVYPKPASKDEPPNRTTGITYVLTHEDVQQYTRRLAEELKKGLEQFQTRLATMIKTDDVGSWTVSTLESDLFKVESTAKETVLNEFAAKATDFDATPYLQEPAQKKKRGGGLKGIFKSLLPKKPR